MDVIELEITERAGIGSGDSRRQRSAGKLPAVVYRKDHEAKSFVMDAHTFGLKARGKPHSQLFKFSGYKDLDGLMGLVKSVQVEPIKGTLMHVEFLAVTEDQSVAVSIPVIIKGSPDCVRQGTATINQMVYEVSIEAKATKIPKEFVLDITSLLAGESLHASDLDLPEGVKLKCVEGLMIVTAFVDKRAAVAPKTAEEEKPVVAAPAAKK